MAALDPAVAAIRTAVRTRILAAATGAQKGRSTVLVACSGGADSLALAAATAFVAPRGGWTAGLVTVDHQLQPGSAQRAQALAKWARTEGFAPVVVETVDVGGRQGGPEASARDARYEALALAAKAHGARAVLLGHTREDQAETVLLALLRGAGLRGLAGMPNARNWHARDAGPVTLVRPLLDISRAQARAACAALALTPWEDPHNADPAFGRARARTLLQSLVESLGPAVVANLAQTARLAAADAAVLDDLAQQCADRVRDERGSLRVTDLAAQPEAVRSRVLHGWAKSLGAPGSALSRRHVQALDALLVNWHGQGPVHLPGGITVCRDGGRLVSPAAKSSPQFDRR